MVAVTTPTLLTGGKLSNVVVGRSAAVVWTVAGLLGIASEVAVALAHRASPIGSLAVGTVALLGGPVLWFLPWERWSRATSLWLVPLAFAAIGMVFRIGDGNGYLYGISFLMVFVWLGIGHPRSTSLRFAPLLAVGYLIPLLGAVGRQSDLGVASMAYVVTACVLVGETVAWVFGLLQASEAALAESRERYVGAFERGPVGVGLVSLDGTITEANRAFADILGYDIETLQGKSLAELSHPDDWEEGEIQFASLVVGQVDRYDVEKRYRHADGHDVWVSVTASCVRDGELRPLYVIGQVDDITERRALREQLAYSAVHDELTGLPNRAMFVDRLERSLRRSAREGSHLALMFLDLDRFKLVNDGLGHEAGDRLLQRVAHRLQEALRPTDLLARFGGDEFTVLCAVGGEDDAVDIAGRLQRAMARPMGEPGNEQFVSLSIGIGLTTDGTYDPSALLRHADVAMYRAKDQGPGHIDVYRHGDSLQVFRSLQTSNELHRALERSELELHYQPVVDLRSMALVGLEALVRWRHPTRGLLPPAEFIPLAEDRGLIVPLGTWVLGEACRQAAAWSTARSVAGLRPGRLDISVNVSAQQLSDPTFERVLGDALAESGLPADQLWLEITEGVILHDPTAVIGVLGRIRQLGVHISIDDFGTGYSSLSYLKQLPVEILKIDRSFIAELDHDADDMAIVRAILALGDSLGLGVIAEGVEHLAQSAQLAALGCRLAQGYLFGRPQSPACIGAFPTDDLAAWHPVTQLAST